MALHAPIELVRRCGVEGKFSMTHDAAHRLKALGISERDVRHILGGAHSCVVHDDERLEVTGADLDGVARTLVIAISAESVIVL